VLKKFIKKRWKLLLILAVILAIGGYILYQRNNKAKEVINFVSPIRQDISETLEVSGSVAALETVRLRFLAGGKVVYIGAHEGDAVKKWQTIATIDRASLQKSLEKDLNLYMQERWDWEDTQDDIRYRTIETPERRSIDKEQWDLTNKVIDVEIRDIAIKNTNLSSPIAGILTHSPTSVAGVQLTASDYFEIVNPETLVFVGRVDEADVSKVTQSQEAIIVLDAFEDKELNSQVSYVAFSSSETSTGTTFEIRLPLAYLLDSQQLRIGLNGDAKIILNQKADALTIPLVSTRERDGKVYVDVKTGENTFEEREITLGLQTDELVEVLSGLDESEEIVLPE